MPLTKEKIYRLSYRAEVRFQYSTLMKYVTVAICFDEAALPTKHWNKRNVIFILTLDEARNFEQFLSMYVTLAQEGVLNEGRNSGDEPKKETGKRLADNFRGWAHHFLESQRREFLGDFETRTTKTEEGSEDTSVESDGDSGRVWPEYFKDVI